MLADIVKGSCLYEFSELPSEDYHQQPCCSVAEAIQIGLHLEAEVDVPNEGVDNMEQSYALHNI